MAFFTSKRLIGASAIALITALSACGGSSNSSSVAPTNVAPTPTPTGVTFSLDGLTTKGLILNGNVDVTDPADAADVLVSGKTSATDGTYDLTIPDTANFEGPFVKVTVTGGADALMVCDAGEGCPASTGTVAFGETFPIDTNVSLSAIVPTPADNGSAQVNLNIFTDLAAGLAETGALTSDAVAEANAQVANLFALTATDLPALTAINIADATTASSDLNALRTGLISGGVLSAAFENGSDIGTALSELRDNFVANDGQLVVNEAIDDPALISMEDIFAGAINAANESGISSDEFGQASAELFGDSIAATAAEAGSLTTASVAPSNTAPALDQAKAFIEDLQLVVEAAQSQETEDNFVDFAERLETVGELIQDDAESALETALNAARAIALAYEAYDEDNTLSSHTSNGYSVGISSDNGILTLAIDESTASGETVQISLTGDLDVEVTEVDENNFNSDENFDENTGVETQSYEESTTIVTNDTSSISGIIQNNTIKLEIINGEISVQGGFSESANQGGYSYNNNNYNSSSAGSESTIILADTVSGVLDVKINQKAEQGLAFEGSVSASLVAPRFENNSTYLSVYNGSREYSADGGTLNGSLDGVDVAYSGRLSEGGNHVDITYAIQGEASELRVANEGTSETVYTYSVENNVLTQVFEGETVTYELLSYADYQAELAALNYNNTFQIPGGGPLLYILDGEVLAAVATPNPSEIVLKRVTDLPGRAILYTQAETINNLYPSEILPTPADFIANPPTDIIDYFNGGLIVAEGLPFVRCSGDSGKPFLEESTFLTSDGGVQTGQPLVGDSAFCNPTPQDLQNFTYYSLDVDRTAAIDPDASASALITASISQNISGIDADDPLVKASLYGPISYDADEASGNLTLKLEFAGRTFQTDARNVDIFGDLTEPVTITNQDGVTMVISESAAGLATGTLSLNGEVQGTISEENGIILVTYTDDTFVSIQ